MSEGLILDFMSDVNLFVLGMYVVFVLDFNVCMIRELFLDFFFGFFCNYLLRNTVSVMLERGSSSYLIGLFLSKVWDIVEIDG